MSSVVIEEIVRNGGFIREFFEGLFCDNLDYDPFERFVLDMTAKRNGNEKEKRNILQTKVKKSVKRCLWLCYKKRYWRCLQICVFSLDEDRIRC